jgi:ligand-binding sensor domain-containing protein
MEPLDGGAAFALATTRDGLVMGFGPGVLLPGPRMMSAFHGLPGNQALALVQGPGDAGPLYVGTPSGLGAIQGSRVAWRTVAGDGKLPHPWVTALAVQGEDLYVGTYGGGVARRVAARSTPTAAGVFEAFPETAGLKVNTGCLVMAGGRLYLGTDGRGLWRLSLDGSRFAPVKVPLPSQHVTAIQPGQEALFVGTDEGLARLPLPLSEASN